MNTWSIDGFIDELMQPTELSLGTAESDKPAGSHWHRRNCGSVYLHRPGGATFARSWLPSSGGYQGLLMTHDEVFSIADYLSLRQGSRFEYRPTVMFVYHPCDDAMLSALELEGRGWQPQPARRIISSEIVTGMDELGVLLAGHSEECVLVRFAAVDRRGTSPRALLQCHLPAGGGGCDGRNGLGDTPPARRIARG